VTQAIYINGRFQTQIVTGVQRFATETVRAMERVWPANRPLPIILSPGTTNNPDIGPDQFPSRRIRPLRDHAWEQASLPWASRDGLLLNLGNTGPIAACRQIVVIHDAAVFSRPEGYSRVFRSVNRLIQRTLVRTTAQIVTVSAFSRRELVRHLGIPEESIEVIPEGAEHILASPAQPDVLARNQLEPNHFVLVVGSLAQHKNLRILGESARMLAARGIPLVITGGFDKRVFGNEAASLPQPARMIGRVTDAQLRALYESACAMIFPSLYEGFGLPAAEAMLCGCPVIAADSASLPEICGDAALFCNPTSPAAFSKTIAMLLDDPGLQDAMRARGLVRVRAFAWHNTARALIGIIDRRMEAT
jgi:glycosyltransferase involved in cell wall biosynthesis